MLVASAFFLPSFFPSRLNNLLEIMELNDNEPNFYVLVKKIATINATHFCLKLYVFSETSHDSATLNDN